MIDDVRWLDADQQRVWRSYVDGAARLHEALSRDLEVAAGLTLNEYEVLVRLSEAPEHTMRMAELADAMAYSRSRVTHTVRRMSDRDLVARRTCPGDGRGVNCVLTTAGWELLVRSAPHHVAGVRRLLVDGPSADDLAALGRVMAFVQRACAADSGRGTAHS